MKAEFKSSDGVAPEVTEQVATQLVLGEPPADLFREPDAITYRKVPPSEIARQYLKDPDQPLSQRKLAAIDRAYAQSRR